MLCFMLQINNPTSYVQHCYLLVIAELFKNNIKTTQGNMSVNPKTGIYYVRILLLSH